MPIPLRTDFDASALRSCARKTKDGPQARRLLALAAIYDGATRTEAAKIGDVTLQIVRDWVMKFNANGPDGLIDRKSPGQPSRLNDAQRAAIAAMVDSGPIPAIHGVVRWRVVDLCQWVFEEFRVIVAKQTLSRELRAMGYRKLSARPRHHAQAEGAIEEYKKRMARPVCKGFFEIADDQSAATYPASEGFLPAKMGDTRVPGLINFSASNAVFYTRLPERRSTVRPSRYHLSQTSSIGQCAPALIDQ
jgi:transposase